MVCKNELQTKRLSRLSHIPLEKTNRIKRRIVLHLGCAGLDKICGAGRGSRTMAMGNIGENWRNTKTQYYVFVAKITYLLAWNKMGGNTDSSPGFLLDLWAELQCQSMKEKR